MEGTCLRYGVTVAGINGEMDSLVNDTYEVFRTAKQPTTGLQPPSVRSSRRLVPHHEVPQLQSAHTPGSNWVVRLDLLERRTWAGLFAKRTVSGTRSLSQAQRGSLIPTKLDRADEGLSNP